MDITLHTIARRFLGLHETSGAESTPMILAMLRLDQAWPGADEVPWCSAFVNYCAWLLDLPRSRSLSARSWLAVGVPTSIAIQPRGFEVVILKRGSGLQPGPEVLQAPGHVGCFLGIDPQNPAHILVLGGNQGNAVSIAPFRADQILGLRSLVP